MTWLIWKIRVMFCKHDFEQKEYYYEYKDFCETRTGIKVSATCKKCGWNRSYWKI